MSDDLAHVWIGTWAGELVRADAVIGLECADGTARAYCSDGRLVLLAESGCPPDFHVQLLRALERGGRDTRWMLVISPEISSGGAHWTTSHVDELTEPAG